MTDYAPRNRQDLNPFYTDPQLALSQYGNANGLSYSHGNSQVQYNGLGSNCTTYSTPFVPSHSSPCNVMYLQPSSAGTMSYHVQPPPQSATLPSQPRMLPQNPYFAPMSRNPRQSQHQFRLAMPSDHQVIETEDQESVNAETMRSEPIDPPLEGYPNVDDFDELMKRYVDQLSPKKRDKALIHARRAHNIKIVLLDKKTTSVESAQFRFWVKKMFTLAPLDPGLAPRQRRICHEGKPVAVREKLFKILTRAHQKCQHGGRDKTSAQVRRVYSWIPKELISRFVKLCPTCQIRRGTNRGSPTEDDKSPTKYHDPQSPELSSPTKSRRESVATVQTNGNMHSPIQLVGGTSAFQSQNRWMSGLPQVDNSLHGLLSEHQLVAENPNDNSAYSSLNNLHGVHSSGIYGMGSYTFNHLQSPDTRFGLKLEPEYKQEQPF